MTKTQTKSRKPAGTATKKPNGKAAPGKKIPIYATLPSETNPEILRANRLLVKVVAAMQANQVNFEPEAPKES